MLYTYIHTYTHIHTYIHTHLEGEGLTLFKLL